MATGEAGDGDDMPGHGSISPEEMVMTTNTANHGMAYRAL